MDEVIVWDKAYSLGIDPIDDQHKVLVAMINDLLEGCSKGAAAADIAFMITVEKTVDYARTHFKEEETILLKAKYPDLASHKKEHFNFMFEVVNIVKEVKEGKTAPVELAMLLKNWLLNHIAVTDKQYVPYLNEKEQSRWKI